jgi:predicted NBD/HSP70 family sugar kinase
MVETPTNTARRARGTQISLTRSVSGRRRGGAAGELRRHNLGVVLERLHLQGALSRSELTTATGLNRSTIADLIGELCELGLAEEHDGPTAAGPGRPSLMVHPRPRGAVALAIEVAVDSVAVATIGLGGHLFHLLRVGRPRDHLAPEATVKDVANLAGPLLDALPADHRLIGVGVGVVGTTRRSDGFVHLAPNLGWKDVPIGELLAEELALAGPVLVANDADLGALAEHRRGAGRGIDHLVYLHGEVGIGAGAIIDGRPLLGSAGYAAEVGHTRMNPTGTRCHCGATGCWETEAGELALLRLAGITADEPPSGGTGGLDTVVERAAAGDPRTLAAIAEVGRCLGIGVGDLVNLFNPELIVLGGFYGRLFTHLEASVLEGVCLRALEASSDLVTITRSELGIDASLIGAAELVLSSVIADPGSTSPPP